MAEGTLHDAFIDELCDLSKRRKGRLTVCEQGSPESLDEKPRGKHCEGISGIIDEGKSIMEEDLDHTTMDACLIAAGLRAEHYEMAAYGTLVAWAGAMGHSEAADLLQQTLDEEKSADKKLSDLAEGGINQGAADAAHVDEQPLGAVAGRGRASKTKGCTAIASSHRVDGGAIADAHAARTSTCHSKPGTPSQVRTASRQGEDLHDTFEEWNRRDE